MNLIELGMMGMNVSRNSRERRRPMVRSFAQKLEDSDGNGRSTARRAEGQRPTSDEMQKAEMTGLESGGR